MVKVCKLPVIPVTTKLETELVAVSAKIMGKKLEICSNYEILN